MPSNFRRFKIKNLKEINKTYRINVVALIVFPWGILKIPKLYTHVIRQALSYSTHIMNLLGQDIELFHKYGT